MGPGNGRPKPLTNDSKSQTQSQTARKLKEPPCIFLERLKRTPVFRLFQRARQRLGAQQQLVVRRWSESFSILDPETMLDWRDRSQGFVTGDKLQPRPLGLHSGLQPQTLEPLVCSHPASSIQLKSLA
jgi:hypothetical protein